MKEKLGTVIGIILFVVILGGIIYLNAFADTSDKELYTEIIIEGNHFLPGKDYLIKSKLGSKGEYQELT